MSSDAEHRFPTPPTEQGTLRHGTDFERQATQMISSPGTQDGLVGQTLDGRYLILDVIGAGGMGFVYRAQHLGLDKLVAIKVLRPEVSGDGEVLLRFRREARAATTIGNQHIIEVSDFGMLPDGSAYLAMEYLEGQPLSAAIDPQWGMEPRRIAHVALQIGQALAAAHRVGIVHRDLKPDNVFLTQRGDDRDFVKVLDFGIAKVMRNTQKLTQTGEVFGTPHYMAPEQCSGAEIDGRADIYAFGVMLYQMATGRVPFNAPSVMGIVTQHLHDPPVPPRELNPNVPEELEAIILRSMMKHPSERYADVDQLLADLETVPGARSHAASGMRMRLSTVDPLKRALSSRPPAPTEKKRSPFVLAVLGAVVLVLGLAGGFILGTRETAPAPEAVPAATPEPVPTPEQPVIVPEPIPIPQPAPVAVATPEPAPVPTTRIASDPHGAEVWRGSDMLGTTPLDVPRPAKDGKLDLELRLPGYRNAEVVLTARSRAELEVDLHRVRPRATAKTEKDGASEEEKPTTTVTPGILPF